MLQTLTSPTDRALVSSAESETLEYPPLLGSFEDHPESVQRRVDLCNLAEQKKILTNEQEFTGVWANYAGSAPTQQLGAALFAIPSLEAFTFPSSKSATRNLAIFPDKMDKRSSITFYNDLDGTSEQLAWTCDHGSIILDVDSPTKTRERGWSALSKPGTRCRGPSPRRPGHAPCAHI